MHTDHAGTSSGATHNSSTREPFTPGFACAFEEFRAKNNERIQALAEEVGEITDDAHWELVDDMKSNMGSVSANDCDDDEESQDECVDAAEAWVSENLGDGDITHDVAMALWLKDDEEGTEFLKEHRQPKTQTVEGQRG